MKTTTCTQVSGHLNEVYQWWNLAAGIFTPVWLREHQCSDNARNPVGVPIHLKGFEWGLVTDSGG